MKLKGKKLLIMGGPALASEIVKSAKNMGVNTIVTDWYPVSKSPAKEIADEYEMVSTSDVKAVVDLIKRKKLMVLLLGLLILHYNIIKKYVNLQACLAMQLLNKLKFQQTRKNLKNYVGSLKYLL